MKDPVSLQKQDFIGEEFFEEVAELDGFISNSNFLAASRMSDSRLAM